MLQTKESTTFVSNKEGGIEAHTEDTKHISVSREEHVGQHRTRQTALEVWHGWNIGGGDQQIRIACVDSNKHQLGSDQQKV